MPSRPGEFHPKPLTDPDLTLSRHPARAIARRLPPSIEHRVPPGVGWTQHQLTRAKWRWPAPFAPRALPRFITTTKQSAPGQRIGTFGLTVGAACAFSLSIADQVLKFRTKARNRVTPPKHRTPPACLKLDETWAWMSTSPGVTSRPRRTLLSALRCNRAYSPRHRQLGGPCRACADTPG